MRASIHIALLTTAIGIAASSATAHAQAWVSPKNTLSTTLDYNYVASGKIIETEGMEFDGADNLNHSILFGLEYAPIEKLAVSLSVPLMGVRWDGDTAFMHDPDRAPYDDGDTHFTLQDARLDARYMVLTDPVAITPLLGVSVPTHDYPRVGFTAPGRRLKRAHAGLSVGWLPTFLRGAFLQASYEFSLVESLETEFEETAEYGQNRSQAGMQIGYFVMPELQFHAAVDYANTHGGVDFVDLTGPNDDPVILYHDSLLDEDLLLLGGGAGYQITPSLQANLYFRLFMDGQNTRDSNVFGLGLSWDAAL